LGYSSDIEVAAVDRDGLLLDENTKKKLEMSLRLFQQAA